MATAMILAFASLFCLILAAHFLRMGAMSGVLVCLALPAVAALTRARWALRCLQALLLLGGMSWMVTALRLAEQRRADGDPWLRMALILGTVAALSVLAAALLNRRSVLESFALAPEPPSPSSK